MEVIGVIIIILLVVIIVSGMNRTKAMGEFSNDFKSIVFRLKNLETTFNNHVYRPDKQDESTAGAETGKTETTEKEDEEYPWYSTASESVPAPEISPAAMKLAACLKKSDEVVETPADQPEPVPKPVTPPELPPIPVMQKTKKTPEPQKEIDAKTFFNKESEAKPETEPEIEIKTKPIFKKDTKSDLYSFDNIPNIEPVEREKSEFEKKALDVLHNIWMWIIVGDDYRRKDISREYAIASTWMVRLATIILLAGSVFSVEYSIDKNLIAPGIRVAICAACAIGLLVFSLRLIGKDKKYDLIGRGLSGGAIAMLYFSVFAATYIYKWIDLTPGFILMVLITATRLDRVGPQKRYADGYFRNCRRLYDPDNSESRRKESLRPVRLHAAAWHRHPADLAASRLETTQLAQLHFYLLHLFHDAVQLLRQTGRSRSSGTISRP